MSKRARVTNPDRRFPNNPDRVTMACERDLNHDMRSVRRGAIEQQDDDYIEMHGGGVLSCLRCDAPLAQLPSSEGTVGVLYGGTLHKISPYKQDCIHTNCGSASETNLKMDAADFEFIDYVDDAWKVENVCGSCFYYGLAIDGINVEEI